MQKRNLVSSLFLLCAFALILGCAAPVRQVPLATPLVPVAGSAFRLTAEAKCTFSTGFSRTLRSGTRWDAVGDIAQGRVYRSPDMIVTAEGAHVHEANLVVKDGSGVGLYLLVEKTFAPFSKPVALNMQSL
jgi:hypothetical protein